MQQMVMNKREKFQAKKFLPKVKKKKNRIFDDVLNS